jgi:hypothetical protein
MYTYIYIYLIAPMKHKNALKFYFKFIKFSRYHNGHVSTITLPDSDEGGCGFNLNNPTLVVDLSDGDGGLALNNPSRSKGKIKVSHNGSRDSRASKHASTKDKDVETLKIRLNDMLGEVHTIKESVLKRS